jgi:hypothetical protein
MGDYTSSSDMCGLFRVAIFRKFVQSGYITGDIQDLSGIITPTNAPKIYIYNFVPKSLLHYYSP